MPELGYSLSCEEHPPNDLVRFARAAEEAGLGFALISDHFHPWIDAQGNSAFVWNVIGAIAHATDRLRLGTGVTCPLIRIHPAIVAQAAATSAAMMPGRFFLGVGTGENLNEHVLGDKWPAPDERLEMLEEAVEVLRLLWQGGYQTHRGRHYTVEQARLYTLPEQPPELCVAAAQPNAAELAGRIGDGFIGVAPERELIEDFEQAGGTGKPRYGHLTACWAASEEEAKRTAHEQWPNAGLEGPLNQELATPADFEAVAEMVEPEDLETLPLGPDADRWLEAIKEFENAGYDHVYIHQIGRDQDGFLEFAKRELLPRL
ncbi:MAG: TIGR03557 family F420-dependent LLM class oxidoreductase [Actinobacteria bacterium]|nr:MAG: TIGR03557 family F420-dependent LLM class oxidoreductase [Actinomycetota bacterium]